MFRPLLIDTVRAAFHLMRAPLMFSSLLLTAIEQRLVYHVAKKPVCYLEDCKMSTHYICAACELPTCSPHLNDQNGLCPRCEANLIEASERDAEKEEAVPDEAIPDAGTVGPPPKPLRNGDADSSPSEAPVATKPKLYFINRISGLN
jgi:hypothetical protein